VEVTLAPYQATVLVTLDTSDVITGPGAAVGSGQLALDQEWTVAFLGDETPSAPQPVGLPHTWESTPERAGYSGAAEYRTEFEADPAWLDGSGPVPVRLHLGDTHPVAGGAAGESGIRGNSFRAAVAVPVREVAVVVLNGVECGRLWAPPYTLDVTAQLRPGRNELRLVVSNTAANALSRDTDILALAEQSAARYGRRFRMQDLDLALQGVASGVLGTPVLTW
jgi:hypothetical protein